MCTFICVSLSLTLCLYTSIYVNEYTTHTNSSPFDSKSSNKEHARYSNSSKTERASYSNSGKREMSYSKSSKTERGGIQNPAREREKDLLKIQQESERASGLDGGGSTCGCTSRRNDVLV